MDTYIHWTKIITCAHARTHIHAHTHSAPRQLLSKRTACSPSPSYCAAKAKRCHRKGPTRRFQLWVACKIVVMEVGVCVQRLTARIIKGRGETHKHKRLMIWRKHGAVPHTLAMSRPCRGCTRDATAHALRKRGRARAGATLALLKWTAAPHVLCRVMALRNVRSHRNQLKRFHQHPRLQSVDVSRGSSKLSRQLRSNQHRSHRNHQRELQQDVQQL